MANRKHVLHIKSNVVEASGQPKKPSASDLLYGEIAVNYGKGAESVMIKNSDDEIVSFVNENKFNNEVNSLKESERVASAALNDLNSRVEISEDDIDTLKITTATAAALNDLDNRVTELSKTIPTNTSIGGIMAPQVTGNFHDKGYIYAPFAVAVPSGRLIAKLATTTEQGFMSESDKAKLDGIEASANNYSLPVSDKNVLGGLKTNSLNHPSHPEYDPDYFLGDFDYEAIGNYVGVASIRKSSYKKAGVIKSNTVIEISDINNPTDKEKEALLNHFKTYGNFSNVTINYGIDGGATVRYASGIFHNILIDDTVNTNLNIYVPYYNDSTHNVSAFKINIQIKIADIEDVLG